MGKSRCGRTTVGNGYSRTTGRVCRKFTNPSRGPRITVSDCGSSTARLREGFVENLQVNIAQLRRYIRDPNLHFKTHQVGRRSKKDLVVAYIAGIVNPKIVKEINRRLKTIDMDDAPESGYIE